MQEAHVVCAFLFLADQRAPGAVELGVDAVDFPAARLAAATLQIRRLVGPHRQMRRITLHANLAISRFSGVLLVEAEILWLSSCGLGTFNRDGAQRLGDQFLVNRIGAVDGQRHATAIDQRRTFEARPRRWRILRYLRMEGALHPETLLGRSVKPRPSSAISSVTISPWASRRTISCVGWLCFRALVSASCDMR